MTFPNVKVRFSLDSRAFLLYAGAKHQRLDKPTADATGGEIVGTKLHLTLDDAYGRTTHRTYGMEEVTTLAQMQTDAAELLAALAAVSDLGCVKASISFDVTSPEYAETAGANVDVGATASGWITAGQKKASMKIPSIKAASVGSDGTVAIAGVVATFLALFEDADVFNLSDGEQIDTWIKCTLDK